MCPRPLSPHVAVVGKIGIISWIQVGLGIKVIQNLVPRLLKHLRMIDLWETRRLVHNMLGGGDEITFSFRQTSMRDRVG